MVRSMAGYSVALADCLAAKRLSTLACVTLRSGSSHTGSITRSANAGAGFTFNSTINSSISLCASCSPTKLGAIRSMVSFGAWDGGAAAGELATLRSDDA